MTKDTGGPAFPTSGDFYRDNGMTLREYAAIKLRVPDSGNEWLDAMILSAKRDEFAGMALQKILIPDGWEHKSACWAYKIADAMLAERNKS